MAARAFLTVDALSTAVLGITLFFAPHIVGDFVFNRKTDGIHWHLIRCVGGQFLASALCAYMLRNASKVAHTVVYITRILVMEAVRYSCFGALAMNFIMLIGSGWPIGNQLILENRIGNSLYQLDSIASICIGGAWLTFPKWLLHRQVLSPLDESHEIVGRVMGALFVCSFAVAQYALHWPSKKDRQVAIDCRVVCCSAILSAQIWSQIAYHDDWSGGHWVGISLYSIWTVAAILYRQIMPYFSGDSPKKKTN